MPTLNFEPWVKDEDVEAQLQDEVTHDVPRVCLPEPQRMDAQCTGKSYGDLSAELWLMYLSEDERLDAEIGERWKWDRDDVLMFTGLLSTMVTIFLTESYRLLSPDLNNAIIASLTQITQLVSISNGAPFQNVIVQSNTQFKPPASAIRINLTWFLSLVLSLIYALSVVSSYSGSPRHHKVQDKYARKLHSIKRPRPPLVIDPMPTLLHLSIFLFIAGLIDFLLLTNKIVAFCVLGYISAFSIACLVFTAFPGLHLDNRRRTSLPGIAWRISLILVLAVLMFVVEIGGLLRGFLSSIWSRVPLRAPEQPSALTTWRDALESQIRKKQRSPADGLRQSINMNAASGPSLLDTSPLCQTQKIKDFVARIPGAFDSGALPCTTSPIISSMDVPSDLSTSDPILGSCFHDLLNTWISDTPALTEESRRDRLHSCLKSLWYCGRAYHRLGNSAPLPSYVHDIFASPEFIGRLQNEPDITARIIGRCFASLVVKKLLSDASARAGGGFRFSDAELASLSTILGPSSETMDRFGQPGVTSLANIISLLSEIDMGKVPPDVEEIMQETIIILGTEAVHAETDTSTGAELPLALVAQFRGVISKVANTRAPEWLRVQLKEISGLRPTIPSEHGR